MIGAFLLGNLTTGMSTPELLGQVASTGIVGIFLVLALFALIRRDRELKEERDARLVEMNARIEDAKTYANLVAAGQREIAVIIANLTKVAEAQENERDERQRLERELQFRERRSISDDERATNLIPRPPLPPRPSGPKR